MFKIIKLVSFSIVLLSLAACGKESEENKCMTREQVLILCIAEGIQVRPEPWQIDSIEIDCERRYGVQTCYKKQNSYFPFDR